MSDSLPPIELAGSIWFHSGATNWGNPRRMALLAAIKKHGSISAAARSINLSYKAAWDAVNTMNRLSTHPLIICTTGGPQGGGAQLSKQATEILTLYQQMAHLHHRFIQRLAKIEPGGARENFKLLQQMLVHTSARNTFTGVIKHTKIDPISVLLTLDIGLDTNLNAVISHESWQNLGLKKHHTALAFIKASAVTLHRQAPKHFNNHSQATNLISARITESQQSQTHQRLRLVLNGSKPQNLIVIGPIRKFENLNLQPDNPVWASVAAENILIGHSDFH